MKLSTKETVCYSCERHVPTAVVFESKDVDVPELSICPQCLRKALELRLPNGTFAAGFGLRDDQKPSS